MMSTMQPRHRTSGMEQFQRRMFQEVQSRHLKSQPISELLPWLLDRRNLDAAWDRVRQAEGARTAGVDGEVAEEILPHSEKWLAKLADDLYHGRHEPAPVRWIEIPKPGSDHTRRLGILTLRDRVVHGACKQVLETVLEPLFVDNSFGFRPGRSVPGALQQATAMLSGRVTGLPRYEFALRGDIEDCFPSIDHELLMAQLGERVQDPAMLGLVRKLLQVGGVEHRDWWTKRRSGVIQGSSLSPLLCNFYLHGLDVAVESLSRSEGRSIQLLRYADDLLLLAASKSSLAKGERLMVQTLRALRLKLNPRKRGIGPVSDGVNWLGVRIVPIRHGWFPDMRFGYVVPDQKVLEMFQRLDEITLPPSSRIDPATFDLGKWITSVNTQLRDWWQVYQFADNAQAVFQALDDHAGLRVESLLQSVTRMRWSAVRSQYRVRLPRGFQTWEINGCRLTVLSSLAPHRPNRLIRRPAWMCRAHGGSSNKAVGK